MEKKFAPSHLDIKAFAQESGELNGASPLTDWPRLVQEQFAGLESGPVHWRLHGHTEPTSGVSEETWLDLEAELELSMQCQRCLKPVLNTVFAERSFRFVSDEATAAALDDEAEEDILVLSRDFDALALVEDELLMALPLVPRHEVCPEAVTLLFSDPDVDSAQERPNPFAALANLKKPPTS
jgi:uncharacterized protein